MIPRSSRQVCSGHHGLGNFILADLSVLHADDLVNTASCLPAGCSLLFGPGVASGERARYLEDWLMVRGPKPVPYHEESFDFITSGRMGPEHLPFLRYLAGTPGLFQWDQDSGEEYGLDALKGIIEGVGEFMHPFLRCA